jgi:hypothetical protein
MASESRSGQRTPIQCRRELGKGSPCSAIPVVILNGVGGKFDFNVTKLAWDHDRRRRRGRPVVRSDTF